ncbi:hypothetical protein DSM106972_007570 [Dulcicalothrix desertica PCC 7102]|uniref:Type I restriction enzyme R protein N-terminal domain-containing protein n=1 Tax=Dulcicalothrix desertica PCC 7102 TaxID=232991 RepID=A0A3S1CTT9_9CYAN|nr:hypothetical protein [Dulcicalothrix desertica]RUT10262.1 hypothetical protein DSM106972_007570 [Dulcicalothrix desertica PCC 7102]TWH40763.1 hypothetical protein CAL7102_10117 [Dulcicalothrix desertica PCC 7102]
MTRSCILQPEQSYTFYEYFELSFAIQDILAELGCSYNLESLTLLSSEVDVNLIRNLKKNIQSNLQYVRLSSESARQQVIIAPILLEVCKTTQTRLNVEYPVSVSEQLKGSFDYYIDKDRGMLVVEAKQADLNRGFTQLAVELIALDQWTSKDTPILYGAVTTGEDWRFGIYKRAEKIILEDIKLYRVPEEIDLLVKTLVGIINY